MTTFELNDHVRYELAKLGLWNAVCKRNPQMALFDLYAPSGVLDEGGTGNTVSPPARAALVERTSPSPLSRGGALQSGVGPCHEPPDRESLTAFVTDGSQPSPTPSSNNGPGRIASRALRGRGTGGQS